MALQIRKGTTANRLGFIPQLGEIIFDTERQEVFVGNGLTYGGVSCIPNTSISSIFSEGNNTGITFTYNSGTGKIDTVVDTGINTLNSLTDVVITDPANNQIIKYNGTNWVNASDEGLVSVSLDTLTDVSISGTPSANQVLQYSGGTWSNSTLTYSLVEDLNPLLGGDLNLNSRDITGTGNIDITGTFNDSKLFITENKIIGTYTNITEPEAFLTDNFIHIGSNDIPNTIFINSINTFTIFNGIINTGTGPKLVVRKSRGSFNNKESIILGDNILNIESRGYTGSNSDAPVGNITMVADPDSTYTDPLSTLSYLPGKLVISVYKGDTTNEQHSISLNSIGVCSVPILQLNSFTTIQRDAITPNIGMVIYNIDDNKFQGFQNTLGTTLEWVDIS